ncbi:hypothetical protein [Helicobacter cappadocius]|uniref:Protein hydE n=1 Tax=Helicobacter cappadocius TaxID=3063998 RepID=A0AA90T4K6_9HELI|nr:MULTISPECIES: hypothetical protein [unclassified Helicobacter]MDO7252551.1 hypothetical protein [Helicobacter sp. faydin-H75]MDP2538418.1 hypothetical protein [Helicobacter sp. faydin-H76]
MIFEFVFSASKAISCNNGFISILHTKAQNRALRFADKFQNSQNNTLYSFFIDCDPKDALDFADEISKTLPSSIWFNFIELKNPENPGIKKWHKVSTRSVDFLDVLTTKDILDSQSSKFCDVFKWVKSIEFLGKPIDDVFSLKHSLKDIATRLKNAESVNIKTSRGIKELSINSKTSDVMFWDISNLFTYMRVDRIQSEVLASYEKPKMKLCPKEVFTPSLLQSEENFELKASLPFDLVLSLLGIFALELEIGYVFLKDVKKSQICLSYECYNIAKEQEIVVSKDGIIIDTTISKKSKSILDIIDKHFEDEIPKKNTHSDELNGYSKKSTPPLNHQKLIVFLSKTHPTNILIKDDKNIKSLFPIQYDNNPKNILDNIKKNYKSGDKLIANFEKTFPNLFSAINSLSDNPSETNNLIDIFSSASYILGYTSEFNTKNEKILNNAKKFLRDKGPRIDFKLQKIGDEVCLDYPKILRSSMSFRIAGLDEATLSYGFVDSMAEFLGNFVRDATMNFNIKRILICGNMLDEKIFLDKILHYLPKNIDLMLPKEGYIDYKS